MHARADGSIVTLEPRNRLERNPVIYCHGAGGTSSELNGLNTPEFPVRRLVRFGFSVIATTLGVEDWWGTREGVHLTRELVGRHRTALGGVGPVVFYGQSMGTTTILQTALTMREDVACIVLALPCFDLEHQRRFAPELRPYINESWDKTPIDSNLDPLPTGANPIDRAAELSDIPILIHIASDDDISYGFQAFADRHGDTTIVDLGPYGHTAAALAQVDPNRVAAFVQAHT